MTTPTTNLTMTNIQTEFGGTTPILMSEYYRGGANVPLGTATSPTDGTPIPTSGTIRMGEFRGVTKVNSVTVNLTINADTSNYNIFTAAVAANSQVNTKPALVTVTLSGFTTLYGVGFSGSSFYALQTGTGWVSGSTITFINNGTIVGYAGDNNLNDNTGAGANGNGANGGAGGTAILASYAMSFTNNGTIAGGGGQGGFGGNGGSPSGTAGYGGAGGKGRGGLASSSSAAQNGGHGTGASSPAGTGQISTYTTTGGGTYANNASNGGQSATTTIAAAANAGGGGCSGGGWGSAGVSAAAGSCRGRNAAGTLTSIGGNGGNAGLALSGISFVNGSAGISGGTIYGAQTF